MKENVFESHKVASENLIYHRLFPIINVMDTHLLGYIMIIEYLLSLKLSLFLYIYYICNNITVFN